MLVRYYTVPVLFLLPPYSVLCQQRQPEIARPVEGDILLHPDSSFTGQTPARLWTNHTVPYVIDSDIPNPSRITDGFTYYNQHTPVKFQERSGEANYVHLVRSTVGNGVCSSNVGMIGGEQFIHVEDACTTAQLIHEMGHTVGFFHEQSRTDRNRNLTVLFENINKTAYSDFPINAPPTGQDVGPYDYASRMHYTSFSFSVSNLPVFQTVPAGIQLNTYDVLSPGDLDTLFRMYGQPPTNTTVVTNPSGLQVTIDGQTATSPQTYDWPPGSTHTLSVADQATPKSRYLFAKWSDGGAAAHTITADASTTFYSANFIQQVQVSVGVAGTGGTTSLSASSTDGYFASQTVLTISAAPAPGYTFLRWSGSSCPRGNAASPTQIVTASAGITCSATFTQSPVTTILAEPANLPVTVDGVNHPQTPVNFVWTPGSAHTISTAAPAWYPTSPVRYTFQGWSDGGAPSHTVTAGTGSATIKASYATDYGLAVPSFNPSVATIGISPASQDFFYPAGTQVHITATPAAGLAFYEWTRDLAGQPNPATLTMNSQMAFGAIFAQNPPALSVASSASFANGSVAPGEIVTIFGNGIGPATPAGAQLDSNGKLSTNTGNTTVTFNGVAAPIVYASAGQTSVVVPYEVAGQPAASVQVHYNGGGVSGAVAVDVSAPGLFTADATGLGQVAAANQDGLLNSPSNPAAKGSIVTFYATGAGQSAPAGVDGAITAAPLPALTQPVSLRIGGKPAELKYAGPAPGQVSGVLQINAVVPADAPSGDAVSVYLVIGNNSSPQGATLSVM